MGKFEKILEELDKGEYDNFSDSQLLSFQIMLDFKVSSSISAHVAKAFLYQKSKTCENCKHFGEYEYEIPGAEDFTNERTGCKLIKYPHQKDYYCNRWEKKDEA